MNEEVSQFDTPLKQLQLPPMAGDDTLFASTGELRRYFNSAQKDDQTPHRPSPFLSPRVLDFERGDDIAIHNSNPTIPAPEPTRAELILLLREAYQTVEYMNSYINVLHEHIRDMPSTSNGIKN
jgi:hypothetical protein